jgi:hypothetical protein
MLNVTSDDIRRLSDDDLRELAARLCRAELGRAGIALSSLTWGGHQDAADGGIDVRVNAETASGDFVPRAKTGFQVKKPALGPSELIEEMRPDGQLRPVIGELADAAGAYVVFCGSANLSDPLLKRRVAAMEKAVQDHPNASQLALDFYDSRRIADWVATYPGLIAWVRSRVGRSLSGWKSHGNWAAAPTGQNNDFFADDAIRLDFGGATDSIDTLSGIERLRSLLKTAGTTVRLVGLSGMGKTRLAQALFEEGVGKEALDAALAIYADTGDEPSPSPTALAENLASAADRAILVVDNCNSELHRRLTEICKRSSNLSILTVEYDIRDDEPEGTEVVRLEAASSEIIEKIIKLHIPQLSWAQARAVAQTEISGGNSRIALALARTVGPDESIATLRDDELFRRLFFQRNDRDNKLLAAAEACSLVYSFDGEKLDGEDAELPLLATLARQAPADLYRHVAEMRRRDLAQKRGDWRAILPHALANRLAKAAIQNIPHEEIERHLVHEAPSRLARSLSRRLGYLHDSLDAVAICARWLSPGGILADLSTLNDLGLAMLRNIAPSAMAQVIDAVDRQAASDGPRFYSRQNGSRDHLVRLIRDIAYDERLFGRCIVHLLKFADEESGNDNQNNAVSMVAEFCCVVGPGTHASSAVRLNLVEELLNSSEPARQKLGLKALGCAFDVQGGARTFSMDFGARHRDFGRQLRTRAEVDEWFNRATEIALKAAQLSEQSKWDVRRVLASRLRGLWSQARLYDAVESIVHSVLADGFWPGGWVNLRQIIHYDGKGMKPAAFARLTELEKAMRPKDPTERIRSIVMGTSWSMVDLEGEPSLDDERRSPAEQYDRTEKLATEMGAAHADEWPILQAVVPEMVSRQGDRLFNFGRGIAQACSDPRKVWSYLIEEVLKVPDANQNYMIHRGFLHGLNDRNKELVAELLEEAVQMPLIAEVFPILQSAVVLDDAAGDRVKRSLQLSIAPIGLYGNLRIGRVTEALSPSRLVEILDLVADKEGGAAVALEILSMHFHGLSKELEVASPLRDFGRKLLLSYPYQRDQQHADYSLARVVERCLVGAGAPSAARRIFRRFLRIHRENYLSSYAYDDFVQTLCTAHPSVGLDELLLKEKSRIVFTLYDGEETGPSDPFGKMIPADVMDWCRKDPSIRLPLAASVAPFYIAPVGEEPSRWSDLALQLLREPPKSADVLRAFIERCVPNSYSGSLAAIIEARMVLLDRLPADILAGNEELVAAERARLREAVVRQRQWEEKRDKASDERFE